MNNKKMKIFDIYLISFTLLNFGMESYIYPILLCSLLFINTKIKKENYSNIIRKIINILVLYLHYNIYKISIINETMIDNYLLNFVNFCITIFSCILMITEFFIILCQFNFQYVLNYTDQLYNTLNTIATEITNNRRLIITLNNISIFSYPNQINKLTEEKLEEIAPLRSPFLNNHNRDELDKYIKIDTCNVCIEEFNEKQLSRTLPCGHTYHAHCIDNWLLHRSSTCPVCKVEIYTEDDIEIELIS